MNAMFLLGKLFCLILFIAALAAAAGAWTGTLALDVGILGALVAVIHVIEVPVLWTLLRRAPGSLAVNIVQTLLFGAFHWLPLKRAARA